MTDQIAAEVATALKLMQDATRVRPTQGSADADRSELGPEATAALARMRTRR